MAIIKEIQLESSYIQLDDSMYSIIEPKQVLHPELVVFNKELSTELELDSAFLNSAKGLTFLTGGTNQYGPLVSQAYAGHQYGHFTMLGDGRAVLLGEHVKKDKKRVDIQLKGSGRTPYSRGGDGKATLYSMLREYLISEAMHALNIPTTRSLAVIKTNEQVRRETFEPGAILIRVASSHIRVGTFEYAKAYGNKNRVKELADYTINRHYPHLNTKTNKYQLFLNEVIEKQASLIAKWQSVGFIHGVMNTDNILISGETVDYGPCAFMDYYDPKTVFSSIDSSGRYAYRNQPYIGSWNLSRFAESMLELLDNDQKVAIEIANEELKKFGEYYDKHWLVNMAYKIGIEHPTEEDKRLIDELLHMMEQHHADFTNVFYLMTTGAFDDIPFSNTLEWTQWFQKWTRALGYRQMDMSRRIDLMKKANPVLIPRNHLVEDALFHAASLDDYTLFNELLTKLLSPYNYSVHHHKSFLEPSKKSEIYKTYCGT